jgi:hypothetical protein
VVMAGSFGLSATDAVFVGLATGSALAGQRVRRQTNGMRQWANGRGHLRASSDAG